MGQHQSQHLHAVPLCRQVQRGATAFSHRQDQVQRGSAALQGKVQDPAGHPCGAEGGGGVERGVAVAVQDLQEGKGGGGGEEDGGSVGGVRRRSVVEGGGT